VNKKKGSHFNEIILSQSNQIAVDFVRQLKLNWLGIFVLEATFKNYVYESGNIILCKSITILSSREIV